MKPRPPTDSRKIRDEFNRRLLWLVLFVLVIVGGGLIWAIYGASAATLGITCLLVGAGVIGLLWLVFTVLGKWAGND